MRLPRIVGTAGHIDHGKSALVLALTGIDPDRLQEEKRRGITIDLGFAHVDLADDLSASFIDVPGHERFVKNTLAGIGGIDAVLLVVAANESVMPQTLEHFAICRLLGIKRGVVAISKIDLVDRDLAELVELEVQELLRGSSLETAAVVHTSAVTGEGLDELRQVLGDCLRSCPSRSSVGVPRLPIDRVFSVHGFGTVVTGTLLSGSIGVGDPLEMVPAATRVNVRGIEVHGKAVDRVEAGQRAALNLQGVQRLEVTRGMVLTTPSSLRSGHLIDARLHLLENFGSLEHYQRVRFHHGTCELLARVALLEADSIEPGGTGLAQLRLEQPYAVAPGDRFIVRRYSPMITIGGGHVIDGSPAKHRRRQRATLQRLRRLENSSDADRISIWAAETGYKGLDLPSLLGRLVATPEAVLQAVQAAQQAGDIALVSKTPLHLVSATPFAALQTAIKKALEHFHVARPLWPSMPKQECRTAVAAKFSTIVFEGALEALQSAGTIRRDSGGIAVANHAIDLTSEQGRLQQELTSRFVGFGLSPPSATEILGSLGATKAEATEVFYYMVRRGELVRLRDDLTFHQAVLQDLIDSFKQHFATGERVSVADFKEWAQVTRKHAIPLLEYLDKLQVTRRDGDLRQRL